MAEESNARLHVEGDEGDVSVLSHRGRRAPVVFVTDASAESVRIVDTLRHAGYGVVDVPLTMLVSHAHAQRPNVVLVDIDADGALDVVNKLRRAPGGGAIDFVFLGDGSGKIRNPDDALANDGSAYFGRPVDIGALVRRMESLTGGAVGRAAVHSSAPPPSLAGKHAGSAPPERPSLPAPGLRLPGPPLPMSTPSLSDLVDAPRSFSTFGQVSNELQQLLAEAEMRAEREAPPDGPLPTPEEEIESVLPADVLASLDEPIMGEEDEENELRLGGTEGTGAHAKGTTAGGSKITSSGRTYRRLSSDQPPRDPITMRRPSELPLAPPPAPLPETEERRIPPPQPTQPDLKRGITDASTAREERFDLPRARDLPAAPVVPPSTRGMSGVHVVEPSRPVLRSDSVPPPSPPPPPAAEAPKRIVQPTAKSFSGAVVMRSSEARKFVAQAVTRRLTGSLCFEHDGVVRRLVLRDGDLVTAASGADRESLVCFLGARGELPREEVDRLEGKIPPYGRHAGAALVAHGFLRQDQLWTVLRAHAEWLASAILRLPGGTAQFETEAPGRLRNEPSVFGASTGPEVFVELVRRAVAPEEALEALGGDAARVGDGPSPGVLAECALPATEVELVSRARGGSLGDLMARAGDVEVLALVHALALLGVLDVVPAAEMSRPLPSSADLEAAALDDEAVRARVRAKLELVEEGDYFAVLGVARDATSYEIRRAFIELRRAFEPTRILSPRIVDLTEDVRKIVVVLEEAYEILRDVGRRERYRRAIGA